MKVMSIKCGAMRGVLWVLPLAAVVLAGCGSHSRTTTSVSTGVTTSTLAAGEAAILDAYRQFQQDYLAAGATMNPDDPMLGAHATGAELAQLRKTFIGLKLDGDVIAGTISVSPRLVSSGGDAATIRDCSTDASRIVKQATGATVGDGSTANELTLVTMARVDGTWKVSAISHQGSGCVAER